jgi:hypothetical protein
VQQQAAASGMLDSETAVIIGNPGVLGKASTLDDTPAPDDIAGMRLTHCVANQRVRGIGNGCR